MLVGEDLLAAADANGLIYAVGSSDQQYSPPVVIYTFIKN
jgi:hypothetical protein